MNQKAIRAKAMLMGSLFAGSAGAGSAGILPALGPQASCLPVPPARSMLEAAQAGKMPAARVQAGCLRSQRLRSQRLRSQRVQSPFAFFPWELPPGSEETLWGAGGLQLRREDNPAVAMFLWLYEWNLFDAVEKGEHTHGKVLPERVISGNQEEASVSSAGIEFRFKAVEDGATVQLIITNSSDHDWPPLAAIIPCFNPGPAALRSRGFNDEEHIRTYFLAGDALELLATREIHFRQDLRPLIDQLSPSGQFVFTPKWPTSPKNACGGLLIRESEDGHWVAGIAWDDYVAVQGHNPWKCMHLAIKVGPLPRGATKTLRGRVYLFPGNRNDCLAKYRKDF